MTINALMPGALAPKFDLIGPTVDDDVRRLVTRYGAAAVKEAATRLTKAKRGPKTIPDWRELKDVIEADAHEWLSGGDPTSARTNYAIAKEFAERNPGQSAISTHKRITRKLATKPYDRRWHMLVTAELLSRENYPWANHIRALEALARHDTHPVWQSGFARAQNQVADYSAKWGTPADDLTMSQVEEGARRSISGTSDLAGLFEQQLAGYSPLGKILAQAVEDTGRK